MSEMLEKLKTLLEINDGSRDKILCLLLEMAKSFAESYTKQSEGLEGVILEIAAYRYGKINAEALESESYSGASFSYSSDLPESIIRQLNSFAGVRFV